MAQAALFLLSEESAYITGQALYVDGGRSIVGPPGLPRGLGPKEVSGMPMYFEDFEVGQRFVTAGRTVTEADVVNFAGVSGDYNPIHTDAEFAKSTPFGQRIAHGLLVLSMLTGLRQRTGATDGTLIAWLEIRNYRFLKPVLIGDTVHGETEIVEKRETSKPDRGSWSRGCGS